MATKKEIYASAMELCETHGASDELVSGLTDLLAPKTGGATVNVEEVFDGKNLQCSVSGVWLPATTEFFYEDKGGKSPFNGLKRTSRLGEAARKAHNKAVSASCNAIMSDVLDGELSAEDGKIAIEAEKAKVVDYSSVTTEPTEAAE